MLYDTHVHFDQPVAREEVAVLLDRAAARGVGRIVAVGGSATANAAALQVAAWFQETAAAAVGFDREHAAPEGDPAQQIAAALACPGVVAVGEVGLDYHYHPETRDAQQALLEAQLALARERRLPVIVHSREADGDTLDLLGRHVRAWEGDPARIGVVHCFTGDADFARELTGLGFYLSFSGILTFRNADPLRQAARTVPDAQLLIETDTPYLAPVPHRGKVNEPAYVREVAAMLADVRGVPFETIETLTARNAERLFGR